MNIDAPVYAAVLAASPVAAALLACICWQQKKLLKSLGKELLAEREARFAPPAANGKPDHERVAIGNSLTHAEDEAGAFGPADLDAAFAGEQFRLFYQPKVCSRSNRTISVEALMRWFHPSKGLISPAQFILVAEQTGRIRALTDWAMAQAVLDQARFGVPVYVNISGALLCDPCFIDGALEIVSGAEENIGFEITETAVIRDPEVALAQLARVAERGISIAIDDYGTGVSSLAYLKQLPANELKIDQAFVRDISRSNRDPLLVRSTIDLAHALDMRVTAEGVEDAAAHALLRVMGCDYIQGYLTGRPMPADQLQAFLREGPEPIRVVVPGITAQA